MKIADLFVEISAKGLTTVGAGLTRLRTTLQSANTGMERIASTARKVFIATAGVIGVALHKAIQFEKQMAFVSTMLSSGDMWRMGGYSRGIKGMAAEFGQSTQTLSKGLYDILSSSIDPAKAMDVLRASVVGAAGGFTDAAVSVDAITTILNSYNMDASASADIMDKLFMTVKRGKLCVTGDTMVPLADGRYERIDGLADGADVLAWDGRGFTPAAATWHDLGEKETLVLETASGRRITTTPEHPYLTTSGWVEASKLGTGDKIAVPTHLPFFGRVAAQAGWPTLLGYLISEGTLNQGSPGVANKDATVLGELQTACDKLGVNFKFVCEDNGCRSYNITCQPRGGQERNPVITQLREWGLWGTRCHNKFIPQACFSWRKSDLAELLRCLFNGDGWLCQAGKQFGLGYGSKSERLVRDISHALLRFGIVGKVRQRSGGHWEWSTRRYTDVRRFVDFIGINRQSVAAVLQKEDEWKVRGFVREKAKGNPKKYRPFWGMRDFDRPVFYDPIKRILPGGQQRVYDLSVPVHHNFVANDIVAHNTYEELAGSIGKAAATAATAGISLEELLAMVSSFTRAGLRADIAMTAVVGSLQAFMKPSIEGAKAAREFGFELNTATLKSEGILGVFQRLRQASPEQLAEIFPNIRGFKGVAAALQNLEGATYDLSLIQNAGGATMEAYSKRANTLEFQLAKLKGAFGNVASAIGKELMPMFKGLAEWLAKIASGWDRHGKYVAGQIAHYLKMAAGIAALVIAFKSLLGVMTLLATHPLAAVLTGIGVAIAATLDWEKAMQKVVDKARAAVDVIAGTRGRNAEQAKLMREKRAAVIGKFDEYVAMLADPTEKNLQRAGELRSGLRMNLPGGTKARAAFENLTAGNVGEMGGEARAVLVEAMRQGRIQDVSNLLSLQERNIGGLQARLDAGPALRAEKEKLGALLNTTMGPNPGAIKRLSEIDAILADMPNVISRLAEATGEKDRLVKELAFVTSNPYAYADLGKPPEDIPEGESQLAGLTAYEEANKALIAETNDLELKLAREGHAYRMAMLDEEMRREITNAEETGQSVDMIKRKYAAKRGLAEREEIYKKEARYAEGASGVIDQAFDMFGTKQQQAGLKAGIYEREMARQLGPEAMAGPLGGAVRAIADQMREGAQTGGKWQGFTDLYRQIQSAALQDPKSKIPEQQLNALMDIRAGVEDLKDKFQFRQ